ncbi:MAG: hypothetical protein ACTSRZ_06800 [Promethearchaeota archaeon]
MSWKQRFAEKQKKERELSANLEKGLKKEKDLEELFHEKYLKLTFFQEISEGFKLYFRNLHYFLPTFVIFSIVFAVLSVLIFSDLNWYEYQEYLTYNRLAEILSNSLPYLPVELGNSLSNYLYGWQIMLLNRKLIFDYLEAMVKFMPFTLGSICSAEFLLSKLQGKNTNLLASIKKVFLGAKLRTTIFILIIYNVLFSFGIAFMIIPGVIFIMLLGFGFFILPDKRVSVKNIMKSSFAFGENYRFRTFLLIMIGVAFYLFFSNLLQPYLMPFYDPNMLLQSLDISTRNWIYLIYYDMTLLVLQGIFQPLILCFLAVQTVEIEIKKDIKINEIALISTNEKFEEDLAKKDLKAKKMSKKNIAHTLKTKGGNIKYYCPHCGMRINPDPSLERGFMKCPHCSEQIYIIQRKK